MSLTRFINRIKAEKVYVVDIPVPLHYVLLILLAWAVLYGWNRWSNRDKWTPLVHEQYGFSVDYPANWMHDVYGESGSKNLHDAVAMTRILYRPISFLVNILMCLV